MSPDIISTIAKEFSSCFCSACFAYSLSMFDTLVFAGSPNKDFFKHTRLWSLIKTYFSSSGMSTLNLQVSASSSIDSDNRALLFVRAKGSCSTDDVDSSSPENRGLIIILFSYFLARDRQSLIGKSFVQYTQYRFIRNDGNVPLVKVYYIFLVS